MLMGYSTYKEIIVSADRMDSTKEMPFFKDREAIFKYIKSHRQDPVLRIATTDIDIISYELFEDGFNFTLADNFNKYFEQGNPKKFVKFYHTECGRVGLIWSTLKKFVTKDNVHVNKFLKVWMIDMFNIEKKLAK